MNKKILLIGKPNSGKSLLFSRLTGLNQKVANFPGVTVEIREGQFEDKTLIDFPGIYSFNAITKDEEIAITKLTKALSEDDTEALICVLDATRLESSLSLGLQAKKLAHKNGKKILFVLNMLDELQARKVSLDIKNLAEDLKAPLVLVSAKKFLGLDDLKKAISLLSEEDEKELIKDFSENEDEEDYLGQARRITQKHNPSLETHLSLQKKLDRFFLSSTFGFLIFSLIMLIFFQSIFTWAAPLMDLFAGFFTWSGEQVARFMPEGIAHDFINEAFFEGFGAFMVFVPQIFLLTFMIGILEDSGYLARAAIICHKPLSIFGLTGKSFVPYLSGHACAIPAILAARTIDSPAKRFLTMLTIPLVACSARLPVYALLIAALIPNTTFAGGLLGYQGLTLFILFFFGILMAILVSGIVSRFNKYKGDNNFILELPPYRLPHWKPLLLRSFESAKAFILGAGWAIFFVTIIVWVLGYFPNGSGQLSSSWLASLGKWIEPVFAPLGLDWIFGVAILASFVAREVFVGTLGTLYGIEDATENVMNLAQTLQAGELSLASGFALLAFYAIALQCFSTLVVLKKETGKISVPIAAFFAYGLLAYGVAFIVYRILS